MDYELKGHHEEEEEDSLVLLLDDEDDSVENLVSPNMNGSFSGGAVVSVDGGGPNGLGVPGPGLRRGEAGTHALVC